MEFSLLKFDDREPSLHRCIEGLSSLDQKKTWIVYIKENKRTDNQNALLWALYGQILSKGGEALRGFTKDDLHEVMLCMHFGEETIEAFGCKRTVPLNRSSKLSTLEFSEYVDHVVRFMAERGIVLSLPGDL